MLRFTACSSRSSDCVFDPRPASQRHFKKRRINLTRVQMRDAGTARQNDRFRHRDNPETDPRRAARRANFGKVGGLSGERQYQSGASSTHEPTPRTAAGACQLDLQHRGLMTGVFLAMQGSFTVGMITGVSGLFFILPSSPPQRRSFRRDRRCRKCAPIWSGSRT